MFVDKQEVLDVTDARPLLKEGQWGLAVKQGQTSFSEIKLIPIRPLGAGPATANFSQKKWHNQDWFFYGLEPIAYVDRDLNLDCKLAACYRMIGSSPACWLQYLGPEWYANTKPKLEVLERGPRLKCLIQGTTLKGEIVSKYLTTITFDQANRSYVYDFDAEFTVQAGKTWPNAYGLEFNDFWPHYVTGPSVVAHRRMALLLRMDRLAGHERKTL